MDGERTLTARIRDGIWDYVRRTGQKPEQITISRKAYEDALMREDEAYRAITVRGETRDGYIKYSGETIYGVDLKIVNDGDCGFVCVGGTAIPVNRTGGFENVQGTD